MTSPVNERRTVSVLRLSILLATGAVLGRIIFFVRRSQVRRKAAGLLEQAKLAEDEGQNTLALDYLSQYIHLVPSDIDSLARYGQLMHKSARKPREKMEAFFILDR